MSPITICPKRRVRAMLELVRCLSVLCLALVSVACGDDASTPGEGAHVPVDGAVGGPEIAAPSPVAPPELGPGGACPDGWTPSDDGPYCEPWASAGPGCSGSDLRFPSEATCGPVDGACAADGFADDLPADRTVVFVRSGATGTGTRADPGGSIAAALSAAGRDAIIALASGTYDEEVQLGSGVGLHGGCTGETILASSTPSGLGGVVTALGPRGSVRRLTIGRSDRIGVRVEARGVLEVDRVVIEGAVLHGLFVAGGMLTGQRLVVRATRAASDGVGDGVAVAAGMLDVTQVAIEGNAGLGVLAVDPGLVRIGDGTIRETRDTITIRGRGLQIQDGATAELVSAAVESNAHIALGAVGAGASLSLSSVLVRDTQTPMGGIGGIGVRVQEGAGVVTAHSAVVRSRLVAVADLDADTSLEASDLVVVDTRGDGDDGPEGRGVMAAQGAVATMDRVHVRDSRLTGLFVGEASTLDARDVEVCGVADEAGATGRHGRGLSLESGATATIARLVVDDVPETAVSALAGSVLAIADATISNTTGVDADVAGGRGVVFQSSTGSIERAVIADHREQGLFIADPSTEVTLTDVVVRDLGGRLFDGLQGRGLNVQDDARVVGTRVLIERARDVGIVAIEGEVSLSDVAIRDTRARACVETTCADEPSGTGLAAAAGMIEVTTFSIDGSALCGLHVSQGGGLDARDGLISENAIGACVQIDGYDVDRLTTDVGYRDNGVNLDITTLPVPVAAAPL